VEKLQRQWASVAAPGRAVEPGRSQAQRREVLKVLGMLLAVGGGTWLASEQVPYQGPARPAAHRYRRRRSLRLDDGSHWS
jgi:transmembrane sensor